MSAAESPVERQLESLASGMVKKYPELREGKRTTEARAELVAEFKAAKAGDLTETRLKALKRNRSWMEGAQWRARVEVFEAANLQGAREKYLLEVAREKSARVEERWVCQQLMEYYLECALERREELSRKRMRAVGLAYTAYVKTHKKPPLQLGDLEVSAESLLAVSPEDGESAPWRYHGAGPEFITAANGYRVVTSSPFLTGKGNAYRWVGYKGGTQGEWKDTTIAKALAGIETEEVEPKVEEKKSVSKTATHKTVAKTAAKEKSEVKLKITIKKH